MPDAATARLQTVDPSNGRPGKSYPAATLDEAKAAAKAAHDAFLGWRKVAYAERAPLMHRAGAILRERKDVYAELMTAEMGKTLDDGRAEIEKCAAACDFFADHAEGFLKPITADLSGPDGKAGPKAFVTYNPLGVVLAVMPWNFPFWQVIRFAAPGLMAGNGAVLKHASNVPGCALALEEVFRDAGFPANLFKTVLLPSKAVAELIADPHIAAVTLTGSVEAGRKVAAAAGAALKKTVLELGGADAYLVLEDADIEAAAKACAAGRMVNAGQSCIAAKRFIVVAQVREAFETAMVGAMKAFEMADPRAGGAKLGPLNAVAARDEIHEQVQASIAKGAKLLLGGAIPDKPGAWYPATVLTNVVEGQPAHDDEVFGPVAAIIEAKDEADAIRIANASEFGLGSAVMTRDLARGERIAAEELEAGMAFVNINCRSDPRIPFGGVKHSGYGRECADFGIKEFVNIKSVVVQAA